MQKVPSELLFITTNEWKVSFANRRLNKYGITVKKYKSNLIEQQELDAKEVALHKAKQLMGKMKRPFIVEDGGLYIKSLNGFPGALVKPILDAMGNELFIKMIESKKDRSASIRSILVYCDPISKSTKIFVGECPGKISKSPKGKVYNGWTLSKIFMPYKLNKTLAQMNKKEYSWFVDKLEKNDHYEKFARWAGKVG